MDKKEIENFHIGIIPVSHLIIPGSERAIGTNDIVIDFTARSTSLIRNSEYLYTLSVPDRARTVFLQQRPDYNPQLRLQILPSANTLFRANDFMFADRRK